VAGQHRESDRPLRELGRHGRHRPGNITVRVLKPTARHTRAQRSCAMRLANITLTCSPTKADGGDPGTFFVEASAFV
jgi:hypothetical protein